LSGVIKGENIVHFYLPNLRDVLYGFLDAPFLWLECRAMEPASRLFSVSDGDADGNIKEAHVFRGARVSQTVV
jgi:hypothetical protein